MKLSIGNYISFINRNCEVHIPQTHPLKVMDIGLFKIEACQIDELFAQVEKPIILDNRDVCGIPLTEKWLIKFGFKWDKNHHDYKLEKGFMNRSFLAATIFSKNFVELVVNGSVFARIRDCKVHQLQNLYYSLTGKELTE